MPVPSRALSRIVILAIAAAAACSLVTATYIVSLRKSTQALTVEAQRRADAVIAGVFVAIEKFDSLPQVVGEHAGLALAVSHPEQADAVLQADRYLANLARTVGASVVYLMDRSGRTVAASNWNRADSFVGMNYAFRPYFKEALAGSNGKFYGLGVSSGMPGYYLSAPVRANGRIEGVLAFKIDLAHVGQGWAMDAHAGVTLADESGVVFLSSRPEWRYRPLDTLTDDQTRRLDRTRQYDGQLREALAVETVDTLPNGGALVDIDADDEDAGQPVRQRFVMLARPLAGTGWTVRVFLPTDASETRAVLHAALAALAAVIAGLVYLYAVAQMRRRAEQGAAHRELAQRHAELQVLNARLRHKAITDPMLGCYNRSYFFEHIGRLVSTAQRHGTPLSIVMLDVDHFKSINDTHGHPVGDAVLQRVAALCATDMREEDVFARFGGEEFIVALPMTSAADAVSLAERLRMRIADDAFAADGHPVRATASFGVAALHGSDANLDAVIRRADAALYEAKRSGRNRVALAPAGPGQPETSAI